MNDMQEFYETLFRNIVHTARELLPPVVKQILKSNTEGNVRIDVDFKPDVSAGRIKIFTHGKNTIKSRVEWDTLEGNIFEDKIELDEK
jgi:hypothetical protein